MRDLTGIADLDPPTVEGNFYLRRKIFLSGKFVRDPVEPKNGRGQGEALSMCKHISTHDE